MNESTNESTLEQTVIKQAMFQQSKKWFDTLIQEGQHIGAVYSISYETALVLIHDHHRREVGGIPS